jgi:hypothetical protein
MTTFFNILKMECTYGWETISCLGVKIAPYENPSNLFKHRSDEESVKEDGAEPVMGPGELGPQFIPPYQISRSGVIPHGTTIHIKL